MPLAASSTQVPLEVVNADTLQIISESDRHSLTPLVKATYNLIAYLAVVMGGIGLFLPLIPTTPFLLLALILLTKSNPKMAKRLMNSRILGVYIRSYVKRQQLPMRDKIRMILLVWISMGVTIVYAIDNLYIRIGLVIVTIAVTVHVAMLRTRKFNPDPER